MHSHSQAQVQNCSLQQPPNTLTHAISIFSHHNKTPNQDQRVLVTKLMSKNFQQAKNEAEIQVRRIEKMIGIKINFQPRRPQFEQGLLEERELLFPKLEIKSFETLNVNKQCELKSINFPDLDIMDSHEALFPSRTDPSWF